MNQSFIRQLFLYRFRYIIGYLVIIVLLVGLLLLQVQTVPAGYSDAELRSAVQSNTIPVDVRVNPIDLPYHMLQKASLFVLGPTPLGIKAPSLLIGFLTGLSMFVLLSRWFKRNVAVVVTILAVTTSQFLIAGRTGSPDIMLLFWPVITLTLATLVSQEVRLSGVYKFLLGIAIVLSLYTPFMIYLLASAFLAAIIHPHLRYIIKRYGFAHISITTLVCGALLVPLAYNLYYEPQLLFTLAGLPDTLPGIGEYANNFLTVIISLTGFAQRDIGPMLLPAFNVGLCILILFGLVKTFQHFYSARSHMLLVWVALLIPVIATNPSALPILYAPAILLAAIGVEALIREWYGLFPSNPYARVAGLLPLALLLGSLVTFSYSRYFNSYAYSPQLSSHYNTDLNLLQKNIRGSNRTNIILSEAGESDAMKLVHLRKPSAVIMETKSFSADTVTANSRIYVTKKASEQLTKEQTALLGKPAAVLVNDRQDEALRFEIYQK